MKRICLRAAALLLLAALLLISFPAAAAEERDADVLYTLGLLEGTPAGFEPEREPTRAEALALAVRLTGEEIELFEASCPFTDVPPWANPSVTWAWERGLIRGKTEAVFGFREAARANDYATMLLRVLGYDDANGDFTWAGAVDFALHLGILHTRPAEPFLRKDMFCMTVEALGGSPKGESKPLFQLLTERGALDAAIVRALGLPLDRPLSGEEIYEKCLPAVFRIDCYENDTYRLLDKPCGQASGFFVREDGVAVSNYHAFQDSTVAIVTLETGARYRIAEMLYYSKESDLVVFRVSRESLLWETVSAFPVLEVAGSDTIRNGQTVYTLGAPLGQQGSIAAGIVGYKGREVDGFAIPMIQNTAPISRGSSGGVLLNVYGQVIGATCAYFTQGQNMNLAIPLDVLFTVDFDTTGVSIQEMREHEEPELVEYYKVMEEERQRQEEEQRQAQEEEEQPPEEN